jgi:hypothetical protein
VIELIEDMPEGTIGLHGSGKISADDYRSVLEPALKSSYESGEVRMLYMLDSDFDMAAAAYLQDTRTGLTAYAHHSAWKRTAIVTDLEWLRKSLHAFHWMVPGELEIFPISELDQAKTWVSGSSA